MDLFLVVTATGDVSKPPAVESAREFLDHAISDFDNFDNTQHDEVIRKDLIDLKDQMFLLDDVSLRLRWAERVLTSRCRLY